MSSMHVQFDDDMPISAAEVLNSDYESVARVAVEPGSEHTFDVPSGRGLLRLHLPSGEFVTLPWHEDESYHIGRTNLRPRRSPTASDAVAEPQSTGPTTIGAIRAYQLLRGDASRDRRMTGQSDWIEKRYPGSFDRSATLPEVTWDPVVEGRLSADGEEWAFFPGFLDRPYALRLVAGAASLSLHLPGALSAVYVRSDDLGEGGLVVSMRVSTTSSAADAVGSYITRGDYYAAETMSDWATTAESMLQAKMSDPFAAAVAGYLLLRLERFDLLHDWPKNLADWFPEMADGCVIWAAQLMRQPDPDFDGARDYFLEATRRGWPIFTEGSRILTEALPRMGDEGIDALRELEKGAGSVLWTSPFTAHVQSRESDARPVSFDLNYESEG